MKPSLRIALALGLCALVACFPASAQPQAKIWRIGFLYNGSQQSAVETGRYPAFIQGMRDLGYVEGRDFVVEARFAPDNQLERLPALAAELVGSKVDVVVSQGGLSGRALKQATSTVPVVIAVTVNPVAEGFAASLAHPGGNFTGLGAFLEDVFPKHVEMLRLTVPRLSRIAALAHTGSLTHPQLVKTIQAVTRQSGVQVVTVSAATLEEIDRALAAAARERCQAVIILGDAFFVQYFRQISGFATRYRLASIYSGREYPEAGGLMSYGPDFSDSYRRAATYVDKILKGAKPGDLPIEQPTKFGLVINRKAAKALGIVLSQELLFRAERVIE